MERFRAGQRVQVANPGHHLYRRRGRVERVRDADGAGQVLIERGLPAEQWLILEGTHFPDTTLLYPRDCDEVIR